MYLNGADRYKSNRAADLLLESGFSVGGDEGFIWDDDFKKSERSSETAQSSREGEREEAEFEFDPYDEILEEMLLVDKLEEALEAEDSTGLFGRGEKYPIVEEITVSFSERLESVLVDDTRAAPEVRDVVRETALFVRGEACPTVEEVVVTPSEELGSKLISEVDLGFKERKSDKNVVFAERAEKTLEPIITGAEAILLSVSEPEGQAKLAGELAPSFRKRMVEIDPRFLLLQEEREFFLGKLGELEVLGSSRKRFCKKLLTFKGKVDRFFTVTSKDMEAELLKRIRDKCGVTDLNILVLQNASWYIDREAQGIFEACNKAIKGKTKKLQFLEFLDRWEVGQESFVDRARRLPKKVNALKKKMLADYAE